MRREIAVLLLACGCAHAGQTIYKCKSQDGTTVYSQQPCGAHAKKLTLKPTREPDAAALSRRRQAEQRQQQQLRASDLDRAEADCVATLSDAAVQSSEQQIEGYQREQAALRRQAATANNNLAGATYQSGIRKQIAALDQSIATERASAREAVSSARQVCSQRRQAAESKDSGNP